MTTAIQQALLNRQYFSLFQQSFQYYMSSGAYRTTISVETAKKHWINIKSMLENGKIHTFGLNPTEKRRLIARQDQHLSASIKVYDLYVIWLMNNHPEIYHQLSENFITEILQKLCVKIEQHTDSIDDLKDEVKRVTDALQSVGQQVKDATSDQYHQIDEIIKKTQNKVDDIDQKYNLISDELKHYQQCTDLKLHSVTITIQDIATKVDGINKKIDAIQSEHQRNYGKLSKMLKKRRSTTPPPPLIPIDI